MKFLKVVLLGLSLLVGLESFASDIEYICSREIENIQSKVFDLLKNREIKKARDFLVKTMEYHQSTADFYEEKAQESFAWADRNLKSRYSSSSSLANFWQGNGFESKNKASRVLDIVTLCKKLLSKISSNPRPARKKRRGDLEQKIRRLSGLPY